MNMKELNQDGVPYLDVKVDEVRISKQHARKEALDRMWTLAREVLDDTEYKILWAHFGRGVAGRQMAREHDTPKSTLNDRIHRIIRKLASAADDDGKLQQLGDVLYGHQ